jgi:protein O-GlcNAc transferase
VVNGWGTFLWRARRNELANHPALDQALRLHLSGEHVEAAELYHSILRDDPRNFDALYLVGMLHGQNGQFDKAQYFTGQALLLNPNSADALFLRSYALRRLDRDEEALNCLDRVLALNPTMAEAFLNRAALLVRLGRNAASVADYERLIALNSEYPFIQGNLLFARLQDCDWLSFNSERTAIVAGLESAKKVISPFHAKTLSLSPEQELKCAQIFLAGEAAAPPLWRGERYAHVRIKIAYLSSDFRPHPVASQIAGVFEHHNRNRFETIGVSFGPGGETDARSRIAKAVEHFFDVRTASDAETAEMLKRMDVDIAVDLTGFTDGCRPGILAQRPAPVQVNFLGFPGTMGADYLDYLIADEVTVPQSEYRHYAEKIVTLPDTFMPADSTRQISTGVLTRAEEGLPDDAFIFCCFNPGYKIAPQMFDIWMRLLTRVERSVLWLGRINPGAHGNLKHEAQARGVAAERLVFAEYRESAAAHLARLRLADLFLDTLPYSAHATASDALWAGLPVLTCRGTGFAGRVGASLLHALGVPELIAESLQDYEALALNFARDPQAWLALKAKIARNRVTHPLFDTARFTRNLETAYGAMVERQRRGLPPAGFTVSP